MGGGRPRRHLRRQAAALLRTRVVERRGLDHQGTPLRPDQQRGESRRGREGVLLLSRLDADPLVHEVPVQYPQSAYPYARDRRHQQGARAARTRVRARRHGGVRCESLLRRGRRIRKGVARRHPDPDHHPQSWTRARHPARAADALVPQRLVLGRERDPALGDTSRARRAGGITPGTGSSDTFTPRAPPRCSSRRTRRTPSAWAGPPIACRTSRTGSTTTSCTGTRTP